MKNSERKAIIYTSSKRSLYVGPLQRIVKRVNVATTLMVSIDGELEIIDFTNRTTHRSKSFLIPAGMNVTIDTHGSKVAQCFLDDLGEDLARLIPQMQTKLLLDKGTPVYCDIQQESEIIQHVDYLLCQRPTNERAQAQIDTWIRKFNPGPNYVKDERVEKAVSMIKEHCTDNLSVEEVAKTVNLSAPRLIQLFKQVTGVPIRRFRLWHRIFEAANRLSEGYSLTDAAIESGFSDYAQFSRVFKEMSGTTPSMAKNHTEIRV